MFSFLVDEHRLRRGRAAVEADDAAHLPPRRERRGDELRDLVELAEVVELLLVLRERRAGGLAEARLAAVGDELVERLEAAVHADGRRLVEAVHDGAERGVVLRVLRDEDQLLDRDVLRVVVAALVPGLGDALAPALLEERQVRVRPAEQEHLVAQRVAAREHREVLHDDRVGERAHDLDATGCRSSRG